MPEEKLAELLAGIVGSFVGLVATGPEIRARLKDLVEDDFFWQAAEQANVLVKDMYTETPK